MVAAIADEGVTMSTSGGMRTDNWPAVEKLIQML
jgi:hypothetical protein